MQRRKNTNSQRSGARRGFAAMPREQVRRIARMGGEASHGGRSHSSDEYRDYDEEDDRSSRGGYRTRSQGGYSDFDEDDEESPREELRMSSRADEYDDDDDDFEYQSRSEYDDGDDDDSRTSRRGFASMPREQVRRIARMGGRASHGGGRSSHRSRSSNHR